MITLGAKFGGPEETAFMAAYRKVATTIEGLRGGKFEEWGGVIAGVNVVFYVPGSVIADSGLTVIGPGRFSRKQKLLLVNVPVPKTILQDLEGSISFLIEALHKANAVAANVFSRKGLEPFDFETAEAMVERVKELTVGNGSGSINIQRKYQSNSRSQGSAIAAILATSESDKEKLKAVRDLSEHGKGGQCCNETGSHLVQ
jgi:hypothetical protein